MSSAETHNMPKTGKVDVKPIFPVLHTLVGMDIVIFSYLDLLQHPLVF
ncbi:MAG: hypothetical protein RL662_2527 [Bacteroidota bacterium]|jgi:hypothetical protein